MSESLQPSQPDAQQLRASLVAEYSDQQINLGGKSIPFKDYVAAGEMLCPIPPEQRTPEANLRWVANELVKSGVQLDEKYAAYIPEQPKPESDQQKGQSKKDTAEQPVKKDHEKIEQAAVEPVTLPADNKGMPPVTVAEPEKLEAPKKIISIQIEVLAQTVKLELPVKQELAAEEPVLVVKEPIVRQEVVHSFASEQLAMVHEAQHTAEPLSVPEVAVEEIREQAQKVAVLEVQEAPLTADVLLNEESAGLLWSESEQIIVGMPEVQQAVEYFTATEEEVFFAQVIDDTNVEISMLTEEETDPTIFESLVPMELPESDSASSYENFITGPVVVAQEFFAQVIPGAPEMVAEKIVSMEPEVAAELASRIEMIVIVADRLHELFITGATEGEEAKQIEAFLKREYEQVLLAVGIEPTREILEAFIAFIFTETYQLQIHSADDYVDIADEGTHEKKLFEEQTVFTKAQQVSVAMSQKLGNNIGRILVTNLSAF